MSGHLPDHVSNEYLQQQLISELGPSMNSDPPNCRRRKRTRSPPLNIQLSPRLDALTLPVLDPAASPDNELFLQRFRSITSPPRSPPRSPHISPHSVGERSPPPQSQDRSNHRKRGKQRTNNSPLLLRSFVTLLPQVSMQAKDLEKWLAVSALDPSIQNMALRSLLPEEVEENLDDLHEAYGSVAKELFRLVKLLSSPLGQLLENIWMSYVESLKETIDVGRRNISAQYSRVSSTPSMRVDSIESSSILLTKDTFNNGDGSSSNNVDITTDSLHGGDGCTQNFDADSMTTGLSPHHKYQNQHQHHQHQHHQHQHHQHQHHQNGIAPLQQSTNATNDVTVGKNFDSTQAGNDVPANVRMMMQRMAEHTISFQRMRQVMFGHLHAAGKVIEYTKLETKKVNELDYSQEEEKKQVTGTTRHLTVHHHADKAQERIIKRRAAVRMQGAYRGRKAKQKLHAQRLKNLMEVTQFEFSNRMESSSAAQNQKGGGPPAISSDQCVKIVERSLWESQRFIRDMVSDWWRIESKDEKKANSEEMQRRKERIWRTEATETMQETCDALLNYTHAIHAETDLTPSLLEEVTKCVEQARGEKDDISRWIPLKQASELLQEGLNLMSTAHQRRRGGKTAIHTQTNGTFQELAQAWMAEVTFKAQQEKLKLEQKQDKTTTAVGGKSNKTGKAKRKKKKEKKKSEFLPLCLREFVTVDQDHGRPMRKNVLLAFIEEIYDEKMIYDEVDDREGHPRHGLPEFIHDHLFRRYGLRSLADHHLYDLVESLRLHKEERRVKLFMRFLGMHEAIKHPLPKDALDFVLYCIAFMHTMHDSNGRPVVNHSEGESSRIPLKIANGMAPVIVSILVQNGPSLVKRIGIDPLKMMSRVRNLIKSSAASALSPSNFIDYDVLLDILVIEFEWVWAQLREHLRSVFIAGDLNADGVLTLDEFTEILHTVSPGVSDNRIHRMFKAALEETQDDEYDHNIGVNSITPDAFVKVAHKYGFLSGDHRTYMPPRPMTRHDSMELRVAATTAVVKGHEDVLGNSNEGNKDTSLLALASSSSSSATKFEDDAGDLEFEKASQLHATNDQWKSRKEARKSKKLSRQSSIHKATHEAVLTKVKHLLAQGISRFGDENNKVRETHFLVKAYNRDVSNRTAFHKLTRAVQTLSEMLDAPIVVGEKTAAIENESGERVVDGVAVGEEKEGDVLQDDADAFRKAETDADVDAEEAVVVINDVNAMDI